MALRKTWTIHAAGRSIEIPNAYHRVQAVKGDKQRLLVIVAVQDGKGTPPLTTWSFGFEPTPGAGDWDAQAYEALKRHPKMTGCTDSINDDPA